MREQGRVRRVAEAVSQFVVRHAATQHREWAAAMAREVDEIPGDWAALRWALGSTRILVERRAIKANARVAPRLPGVVSLGVWFLLSMQSLNAMISTIRARTRLERLGWALVMLGWAYWQDGAVSDWLREREMPSGDLPAMRRYLRKGLELRLQRYRSMRRWTSPAVTVAMCCGYLVTDHRNMRGFNAIVVCIAVLALWIQCLDTPQKIEARLARLEETITQNGDH